MVVVPGHDGRVVNAYRSAIDLAPTILALMGVDAAPSMEGASLVDEIFGGEAPPRDVISDLPEDEFNEHRRAIIHDGWKLIAFGSPKSGEHFVLYNLTEDPQELTDKYKTEATIAAEMTARYREACSRIKDVAPIGGIPKH